MSLDDGLRAGNEGRTGRQKPEQCAEQVEDALSACRPQPLCRDPIKNSSYVIHACVNSRVDDVSRPFPAQNRQAGVERHPSHGIQRLVRVGAGVGGDNHLRQLKQRVINARRLFAEAI
jgi:hypothetical protein